VGADNGDRRKVPGTRRGSFVRWLRACALRLAGMFRKQQRDLEFAAEMESHLQMHIEDNLRSGMSTDEARRTALTRLGGVEPAKELYRERRSCARNSCRAEGAGCGTCRRAAHGHAAGPRFDCNRSRDRTRSRPGHDTSHCRRTVRSEARRPCDTALGHPINSVGGKHGLLDSRAPCYAR